MSYNISDPLPNKYDNPSEKVRKTSGDLDDTKQALVTTIDTVVKERNTEIFEKEGKSKQHFVEEAITPPISAKNKIDTVKKA